MTKHDKNNKKQTGGGMFEGITNAFSGAYGKLTGSGTTQQGQGQVPAQAPAQVPAPAQATVPVPQDAKETEDINKKCDETTRLAKEEADKTNVTCKAAKPGFKLGFFGMGGKRTRGGKSTNKRSRAKKSKNSKKSKTSKKH